MRIKVLHLISTLTVLLLTLMLQMDMLLQLGCTKLVALKNIILRDDGIDESETKLNISTLEFGKKISHPIYLGENSNCKNYSIEIYPIGENPRARGIRAQTEWDKGFEKNYT